MKCPGKVLEFFWKGKAHALWMGITETPHFIAHTFLCIMYIFYCLPGFFSRFTCDTIYLFDIFVMNQRKIRLMLFQQCYNYSVSLYGQIVSLKINMLSWKSPGKNVVDAVGTLLHSTRMSTHPVDLY